MASTMLALRDSRSWEAQKKWQSAKKRHLAQDRDQAEKRHPPLMGQGQKKQTNKNQNPKQDHLQGQGFTNSSTQTEARSPLSGGHFAVKLISLAMQTAPEFRDAGSSVVHLPSSPGRLCRGRVCQVQISWWSGPVGSLHTQDLPPHSWPREQKQKTRVNGSTEKNTKQGRVGKHRGEKPTTDTLNKEKQSPEPWEGPGCAAHLPHRAQQAGQRLKRASWGEGSQQSQVSGAQGAAKAAS